MCHLKSCQVIIDSFDVLLILCRCGLKYCCQKLLNLLPSIGEDEEEGSEAFEVCTCIHYTLYSRYIILGVVIFIATFLSCQNVMFCLYFPVCPAVRCKADNPADCACDYLHGCGGGV